MRAEYKQDIHRSLLLLREESTADTESYQVRMLSSHAISSVLPCQITEVDGEIVFTYDVTGYLSVSKLEEGHQIQYTDLIFLLGEIISMLEIMSEYLLNPSQLLLMPEYMFTDLKKEHLYFCVLPGYEISVPKQLQDFMEYILPKMDHQDSRCVSAGYSIHQKTLEEPFLLEQIKEIVFRPREERIVKENINTLYEKKMVKEKLEMKKEDFFQKESFHTEEKKNTDKKEDMQSLLIYLGFCGCGALLFLGIIAAGYFGYIEMPEKEMVLGGLIVLFTIAYFCNYWMERKRKKRKEKNTAEQIRILQMKKRKKKKLQRSGSVAK